MPYATEGSKRLTMASDEPSPIDALNRERYSEAFARLAESCETPFVVGIYGDWGIGKTTMLKLIKDRLNPDASIPVWFNLWEHQFDENPVIPLVQTIAKTTGIDTLKKIEKILYLVAMALGSYFIKKKTDMDLQSILQFGRDFDQANFRVREARSRLREHLGSIIRAARRSGGKDRRLVFFIDDLDRCDPPDALKLLEALKLYLNCEGCVYFVAMDRAALTTSVREKYGKQGIGNAEYLDKIIQLPFTVPPIEPRAMADFVAPLLPRGLESCRDILVRGLGSNPRSVKRFINLLSFNHGLATRIAIPDYDPCILALILFVQSIEPEGYRTLSKEASSSALERACAGNELLGSVADGIDGLERMTDASLRYYLYLTGLNDGSPPSIDLKPLVPNAPLIGRYVLWVDDEGLPGSEGIAERLQGLGVELSVVKSTELAEAKIAARQPDLVISDIGRGDNYSAGLEMAESFRNRGIYRGPVYFFAADTGHGRIGRANAIGARLFVEREPLVKEVIEYLRIHNRQE
jgi:CheY-like chemotaxis protein